MSECLTETAGAAAYGVSVPSSEYRRESAQITGTATQPFVSESAATRFVVIGLALVSVLILLAFEIEAILNHYETRVIADTPTFLALIRDLAIHPLKPDSLFFGTASADSIHTSPYLQILALIWRMVAPGGHLSNPIALGDFAAIVTIPITLFVLSMVWLFVFDIGGRIAAWAAVPALLVVFGPVHVAFPGDLTLNGFLDTGYYPTTFATGLTLATLVTLRRRGWWWSGATAALTALTLTTDPFNGALLVGLMTLHACLTGASDRNELRRVPLMIAAAFALAWMWPALNIFSAFQDSGLPVPLVLLTVAIVPVSWVMILRKVPVAAWVRRRTLSLRLSAQSERRVAEVGAWGTLLITLWGLYLIGHWPTNVPVLQSYRLGFYWNDDRNRWLLLFLPGICGLIGLGREAASGRSFNLLWFCSLYAVGAVGAILATTTGYQLPLYYRMILACQVPLAVGVGMFVAHHKSRQALLIMAATLVGSFAYKTISLLTVSNSDSYFGAPLSTVWRLGAVIPAGSGVVASDPNTSYFMPIVTGNLVLTVSKGHADSGTEPVQAEAGYELLRRVYVGTQSQAASALRRMWTDGVRWVVVEKFTTFRPPTQQSLYAGAYNALITEPDINLLASYNSRLAAVGRAVFDNGEFTVYRLERWRLMRATAAPRSFSTRNAPKIARLLGGLARDRRTTRRAAKVSADRLYRLGVRMVTLSYGELGSTPTLTAYGRSMSNGDIVRVTIPTGVSRRWVVNCLPACYEGPGSQAIAWLGRLLYDDGRFSTTVALGVPVRRS